MGAADTGPQERRAGRILNLTPQACKSDRPGFQECGWPQRSKTLLWENSGDRTTS